MKNDSSSIEAWAYGSVFNEFSSWINADAFAHENVTLTKALEISLSDDSSASETLSSSAYLTPFALPSVDAESSVTPANPRGWSGSNPIPCSPIGKISKRKSRASKRSPTTYINADPANFRRMVQEVTGIRFGGADLPVEEVVLPEPQRTGTGRRWVEPQGYLPTLDTSAVLLDRTCGSFDPVLDGSGFDFEPLPSFPTLESWGM
ncbi:hypothetical protein KSP40_PGU002405 [Platanthera guangdongensis]|uniref:VQ domain-containing protein n=1 Tax=Platanthera guangdongensis TaxID=2320717 RepID=A0ABR2MBW5_9ASPA